MIRLNNDIEIPQIVEEFIRPVVHNQFVWEVSFCEKRIKTLVVTDFAGK